MPPTTPHPSRLESFGDAEGLVDLGLGPSRRPSPPNAKPWERRLLVVFLAVTLVAGLVDTLLPIAIPPLAGQEQVRREARRQALQWHDGSWARWIEEDRHLRSRVRHHLLPPYALLLYQSLGEVHGDLLHGRGGWLFLRQRVEPRAGDDGALLQAAAINLQHLQRWTAARGHRLVVVPLPRKAAVAATRLPKGIDARPRLDRRLPEVLAAHGVDSVNIWPDLDGLEARWGETPYFRGDSHLTQSAMQEAAERVAEHLGMDVAAQDRRSVLDDLGPQPAEYDLLRFVGIRLTPWTRRAASLERRRQVRVLTRDGAVVQMSRAPTSQAVALVGTSFSTVTNWAELLAHAIDRPVLNAAEPGEHPFTLLHRLLTQPPPTAAGSGVPATGLPPVIVLELPNHVLFDNQGLAAAQLFE